MVGGEREEGLWSLVWRGGGERGGAGHKQQNTRPHGRHLGREEGGLYGYLQQRCRGGALSQRLGVGLGGRGASAVPSATVHAPGYLLVKRSVDRQQIPV